jgi:hypothetical protein
MVFIGLTVGVVAVVLIGSVIFGVEPQRATPNPEPSYFSYETRSEIHQSP